jgi:hypothetical protein
MTDQQAAEIRSLLAMLGSNQKELSEVSGTSKATISMALSHEERTRARVSKKTDELILTSIEKLVTTYRERLERSGQWSKAQSILRSLSQEKSLVRAAPGGIMRIDASNYIRRTADRELEQEIENGTPGIMVAGGVQIGKSSLFLRISHKYEEKGRRVIKIFLQNHLLSNPEIDKDQFTRIIIEELGVKFAVSERESSSQLLENLPEKFHALARSEWKDNAPVIIIDGANMLYENSKFSKFSGIVSKICLQIREISISNQLNISLVINYISESEDPNSHSTIRSQFHHIRLEKFSDQELDALLSDIYPGKNEGEKKNIRNRLHEEFHGHPCLCQFAVHRLHLGESIETALASAQELRSPYLEHWKRVHELTKLILRRHKRSENFIQQILKNQSENQTENQTTIPGIPAAIADDLLTMSVLGGSRKELRMCKFYRNAFLSE